MLPGDFVWLTLPARPKTPFLVAATMGYGKYRVATLVPGGGFDPMTCYIVDENDMKLMTKEEREGCLRSRSRYRLLRLT